MYKLFFGELFSGSEINFVKELGSKAELYLRSDFYFKEGAYDEYIERLYGPLHRSTRNANTFFNLLNQIYEENEYDIRVYIDFSYINITGSFLKILFDELVKKTNEKNWDLYVHSHNREILYLFNHALSFGIINKDFFIAHIYEKGEKVILNGHEFSFTSCGTDNIRDLEIRIISQYIEDR